MTGMPEEARRWRERFHEDITAVNLRRIWWLVLASTVMNLGVLAFNLVSPSMRLGWFAIGQTVDFAVSILLLLLVGFARRSPQIPASWRGALAYVFLVLVLAFMNTYYLILAGTLGHSASYVLGVVTVGVLLLLPPAGFLGILLANHAVYCGMVLLLARPLALSAILDGTVGVFVAGFAQWFLYRAKWNDYHKERIIAERNRELRRSNEELNEIMAIASHDLRSPLHGLRNLLEGALGLASDTLQRPLGIALQSCETMLALVGRLLDAHAAEHGFEAETRQTPDLRELVRSMVSRLQGLAEKKTIRIANDLPGGPAEVSINAPVFEQIFENLLSNAVKFSPPGSTVEAALYPGEAGWAIEVRDEGPGIPEDERPFLFQKFHRGSAQPTGGESSTGLGLYIVKKLADRAGLRLEYFPREPRGSIFRVSVPVEKTG